YGGNRTVVTAPTGLNTLNNTTLNEGTFVAATGENYQRLLARFTGDASEYDTPPPAQNTQVSAFNDFEYRFTPTIAALGRAGYQNIRYPSSPAATFAGATWLVGGQIGTVDPVQPKYFSLEYGKIQGVYGFTGVSQFYLTPTLVFSANASHGVSSQSQYFQNSLAASALSPSGGIVDQYTGLPTAFYNPGIGLTNNVYRQHIYNAGLTDTIPPNSYSLYGFYYEQQSLTPPTTAPTKSAGISLSYSRDIRPDLRGSASVGYANSVNSPVVSPTGISSGATGSFYTVSGQVGVNYLLARNLTASLFYTFSYQSSGTFVTGGRNGDVIANLLQFQLSKTF
ncbi:MAG TPA: hypothetical protein VE687_07955, partial [Stellaceae bacterium]|nr:hypothetical protein [Stellaceae bacterium]